MQALDIDTEGGVAASPSASAAHDARDSHKSWEADAIYSPLLPFALTTPAKPSCGAELLEATSTALSFPLLRIGSHVEIAASLLDMCEGLSTGRWQHGTGSHARALQAPKGVGKSVLLRSFTAVCQSVFPDVIPIYVSYAGFQTDETLQAKPIHEMVLDKLILHGVLNGDEVTGVNISRVLQRSDKRLLLLVDEVDELYRVDDTPDRKLANLAKACMGSLSSFANLSTGRVSVVVCSSTASLRKLLACSPGTDSGFYSEFPNLKGAPLLNATKFDRFVVTPASGVNLSVARAVLQANFTTAVSNGTARWQRLLAAATHAPCAMRMIHTTTRPASGCQATLTRMTHGGD